MPPLILEVVGWLTLAAKAAPDIKKFWDNARRVFAMWFAGGLITAAQQTVLRDWADDHEAKTLAGEVPPELTVEPDPA